MGFSANLHRHERAICLWFTFNHTCWIAKFIFTLQGIELLDLSNCERVDDMGLKVLAAGCWNLQTLKLRNCDKVTDVGLVEIARMCPHLREVDLTGCQRVCEYGDKSLVEFVKTVQLW